MKFGDLFRFAGHNLMRHKARPVLTACIVTALSLILIGIMCIAISFTQNVSASLNEVIGTEPIIINAVRADKKTEYYQVFQEKFAAFSDIVDYVEYHNENITGIVSYDLRKPLPAQYDIIEGETPGSAHSGTNVVFLDERYKSEGKRLGDMVRYGDVLSLELRIAGFFRRGQYGMQGFADVEFLISSYCPVSGFTAYSFPNANVKDRIRIDRLLDFQNELIALKPQSMVYAYNLDLPATVRMITVISIAVAVLIDILLLLLSVGSISNSLLISMDENRRFTGLCKALGMTGRNIFAVVAIECAAMVLAGIAVATAVAAALGPVWMLVAQKLTTFLRRNIGADILFNATFSFPFYVPIICFVFFMVFTLLFARAGIARTIRKDPVSLINEGN